MSDRSLGARPPERRGKQSVARAADRSGDRTLQISSTTQFAGRRQNRSWIGIPSVWLRSSWYVLAASMKRPLPTAIHNPPYFLQSASRLLLMYWRSASAGGSLFTAASSDATIESATVAKPRVLGM